MHPSLLLGYCVLSLAQVTISINVVTGKYLLESMPMFLFLACRFGVSTLLLALILKCTRTPLVDPRNPQKKLLPQDWLLAILAGLFAALLFNVFFVWGLQHTTATAAGIVGSTLPAIIALSAVWLLKERLNFSKIFALILAIIGVLIINVDSFEETANLQHTYFGDFLILLAMFPEAFYSIISRKLAGRITPLGAAFIANAVGFLSLLPCALLTSTLDFSTYSWFEASLIFIAGLSSLIFFWAWGWGLTFIPASTAAIFGGIMPVATAFFAIVFLSESLHWYDMLGMGLVLTSIAIGAGCWRPFRKTSA